MKALLSVIIFITAIILLALITMALSPLTVIVVGLFIFFVVGIFKAFSKKY